MSEAAAKVGRPSLYTPELGLTICQRISNGESLRGVCRDEAMPDKLTVLRWLQVHPEFRTQYEASREDLLEHWAEDIIDISDDGEKDYTKVGDNDDLRVNTEHIQRSRLRVDSRKWLLSKLGAKKYGDRLEIKASVTEIPANAEDLIREAAALGLTPDQLFGRQPAG